jgi:hypothetical protein
MSDIETTSQKSADPSALLGSLLSNPDLLRNISSMLGGGTTTAEQAPSAPPSASSEGVADGISRVLSNPEMMAKLPDVMKMLAPMVQGAQSSPPVSLSPAREQGERDRRGCRNDLLIALKPFLSPERCRAIDMLLGLSRLGDALQKMI